LLKGLFAQVAALLGLWFVFRIIDKDDNEAEEAEEDEEEEDDGEK